MADRRLTPDDAAVSGVAPTVISDLSTSDTYQVKNDGSVVLRFAKTGSGACTVTVITPGTVSGYAIADPTATVPASTGVRYCGPFPTAVFSNSSGDLEFTVSEVTGLSVEVTQL